MSIGPGGGQVGPGGEPVGPAEEDLTPPSGVISLVGGLIVLDEAPPYAEVGPGGGEVGPIGSQIGPADGYPMILNPPSGVLTLSMDRPAIEEGEAFLTAYDVLTGDAGWCWFQDPRAIHGGGKTFLGVISGEGHPMVLERDDVTGVVSTPARLYPTAVFEIDDHDNPALLILPDGRLLAAFTTHVGDPYTNVSTNPYDATAWEGPVNLRTQVGRPAGSGYTYAHLHQLLGETDSPIYLYMRYHDASSVPHISYTKSTDGGETWSARVDVMVITYHKIAQLGDRLEFVASDHPEIGQGDNPAVHTSIYHFAYEAGVFMESDGTPLSLPIGNTAATLVYDGTTSRAWIWDIAIEPLTGNPVVVYVIYEEPAFTADWIYGWARWNGASWDTHEVAQAGTTINPTSVGIGAGPSYSGGIVLDQSDPSIVYYSSNEPDGLFQIYRARTFDLGVSWLIEQLTDDNRKNVRPITVRDYDQSMQVAWLHGRYDSYIDWEQSMAAAGVITPPVPPAAELHQLFDISDNPSAELHQLFSLEGPLPAAELHQLFDLRGLPSASLHQPFDILGPIGAELHQLFDIRSSVVNEVQVIVSGGVVTSYVLTFDGETTTVIAGTANAAAVQAALEALSNLAPGDVVVTGGPLNTTDLIITFGGTYAGVDVPQITVVATGVTGSAPVGSTVTNGGPSVIGGSAVASIPPVWRPLMVFDKAGNYIGSISAFNVTNPPVRYLRSMRVTNDGAMTFNVSRHSPDAGLIASDRLVLLQSPQGEKPWWGTMSHEVDARGILERPCRDPWTLLRDGPAIVLEEEVDDDTPAAAVMAKIMGIHNDLRAATGEVQWELDLQGSRPFRGDIDFDADTLSCIDTILSRSRTEIAWDSRLDGNRLVPILRMRDRFDAGAGADVFDGPDGNVTSGVQVVEDPTPLVFSIRLHGMTTDLAKCLPDWAEWALLDIAPEVTVSVDPGPYRNRQRLEESVDWGLSKRAVSAQCNAIVDWLWGLYRSFLMAVHDIEGRPWHEGWAYLGPPDHYEPKSNGKDSLSRRAWKTRLQLVEARPEEPASAVMISENSSVINLREWLIVRYNRVTGVQSVTVWAIESATGLSLIKWEVDAGGTTLYRVSGDRVVDRDTIASTGAFVDPYNTRVWDPVAKRYRNLRRIINGPFALAYYIDPADVDNSFVDLGVDAAISTTSGDGSSLISKIYPFERLAIENWDPRRDGIGQRLARPTVFNSAETTRPRWHVTTFNVGGDANTTLTHGISSGDTEIEIDSIHGFPDPDVEADQFPFLIAIDDGLDEELVLVVSMTGTQWQVLRGQGGTAAIIHEAGAPVRRFGAEAWEGFPWSDELKAWPEGEQWAREELEELSKPRIDLDVHIAHFRGDQLTVDYGSSHTVDVATEGRAGRWIGTGRVIGWSTDPGYTPAVNDPTPPGGETEVVLEWEQ